MTGRGKKGYKRYESGPEETGEKLFSWQMTDQNGSAFLEKGGVSEMKWMIVADSSCDLETMETGSEDIGYDTVPFQLTLDDVNYTDNPGINIPELVDRMEAARVSHSACPSPDAWAEKFLQADHAIAFTISSRLSGSYNSAILARDIVLEQHPEKQIEVIELFVQVG